MRNFIPIKTIGKGAFGKVMICRNTDDQKIYAMKQMKKKEMRKKNQIAHIKAERDVLALADNDWVVKLAYSFQDRKNLSVARIFVEQHMSCRACSSCSVCACAHVHV